MSQENVELVFAAGSSAARSKSGIALEVVIFQAA
jgi:hypothetical protein